MRESRRLLSQWNTSSGKNHQRNLAPEHDGEAIELGEILRLVVDDDLGKAQRHKQDQEDINHLGQLVEERLLVGAPPRQSRLHQRALKYHDGEAHDKGGQQAKRPAAARSFARAGWIFSPATIIKDPIEDWCMVGSRAPSASTKNMILLRRMSDAFQPNFSSNTGANSSAITPDVDGHADRRLEQHRGGVEVTGQVEVRQVPVTPHVDGDGETAQRVAKQARQQRRSHQRVYSPRLNT